MKLYGFEVGLDQPLFVQYLLFMGNALKGDFDAWLFDNPSKHPRDYNAAFYGFVKQHHSRNKHQLRGGS